MAARDMPALAVIGIVVGSVVVPILSLSLVVLVQAQRRRDDVLEDHAERVLRDAKIDRIAKHFEENGDSLPQRVRGLEQKVDDHARQQTDQIGRVHRRIDRALGHKPQ